MVAEYCSDVIKIAGTVVVCVLSLGLCTAGVMWILVMFRNRRK